MPNLDIISSISIDGGSNVLPSSLAYGASYSYPDPSISGTHTIGLTITNTSNYPAMFAQQMRGATVVASNYFAHAADGTTDVAMSGVSLQNGDVFAFRAANLFLFSNSYVITGGAFTSPCGINGSGNITRIANAMNDANYVNRTVTVSLEFVSDTGAIGYTSVSFSPTDTTVTIPAVTMTGGSGTCTTYTASIISIV